MEYLDIGQSERRHAELPGEVSECLGLDQVVIRNFGKIQAGAMNRRMPERAGFAETGIRDETEACLNAFRRSLFAWPDLSSRLGEKAGVNEQRRAFMRTVITVPSGLEENWSGRGDFERPTLTLARLCSTPELRPLACRKIGLRSMPQASGDCNSKFRAQSRFFARGPRRLPRHRRASY